MATPFCSCSAVPLFIGLVEAGVPLVAGKKSSGCKKTAKKTEYEQPVPAATVTGSGSPSPSATY